MNAEKQIVKLFADIEYAVVAEPQDYSVNYRIYQIVGTACDGKDSPLFQRKDSHFSPDPVESLDDAEIFAHGFVKWDGCSNWAFTEDGYIHWCNRKSLIDVGLVLARCWDMTRELCPNWLD